MAAKRCCICGDDRGVAFCNECGHNFCDSHRRFWYFKGMWQRGTAAIKTWINGSGVPYCTGHEVTNG